MPHKHTRKGEDKSTINLPPSTIAKPLSTAKGANSNGVFTTEIKTDKRANKKRKRKDDTDDTPKAFARLMAFQQGKKLPKGLDDGVKPAKKKARKPAEDAEAPEPRNHDGNRGVVAEVPKIRVGEKMSEFSARVDAALPVSGLINKISKQGKDPVGLKVGRTKTERRMHRMYDEWREQDKKIKEAREEAAELKEEEMQEDEDGKVQWKADLIDSVKASNSKKKGKAKKKKVIGEMDDGEDDPWAAVKKARNEGPRRLNDVVLAPPTLKAPRAKFKVQAGARVEVEDVPKASGSLRRREELGEVRRSIVESYRAMMKGNQQPKEEE
ncbi:urease accessory protein [Phlyctema vagabunda]|uniref:Urease accessory protein n=1 Tax=Phlyctema vagabunda TaxID=108571 RepID=A0ABR4PUA0_9HELO